MAGVVVNDFFPIATDLNNLSPNRIRIEVNTTSGTIFSPGATGELKLLIDGVHTDVNGAAAGNDLAFTWDSQGAGYMGFSSNIGIAYGIDNLVISTVPEASSFSAAAFAFCVFVAKFRRRFARDELNSSTSLPRGGSLPVCLPLRAFGLFWRLIQIRSPARISVRFFEMLRSDFAFLRGAAYVRSIE